MTEKKSELEMELEKALKERYVDEVAETAIAIVRAWEKKRLLTKDKKIEEIPFNRWSQKHIDEGTKFATTRTREWNDPRVIARVWLPLWFIRDYLYRIEGAETPEEYQRVINQIFRRKVQDDRMLCVHFGDFRKKLKVLTRSE